MLIVSTVYQVLYSVAGEEVVQQMQQKFPMYSMKMFGNIGDSRQFYVDICTTARLMIADQRKKKQCDALQPCDPHHQREICRSGSVPCLGQHRDFRQPELLKCTFEKGYR